MGQIRPATWCGVACLLAIGTLSSCDAGPDPASPSPASQATDAVAGMPFDAFPGQELAVINQAISATLAGCMEDAGFPQLAQADAGRVGQDEVIGDAERLTQASFGPVDEAAARRDGLRSQPEPEPPAVISHDPSFDAEAARCSAQAQRQLGTDVQATEDVFYELFNEAQGRMFASFGAPEFREIRSKLLDCLVSRGFVPSDREAFLVDGNQEIFGFEFGVKIAGTPGDEPAGIPGTVEVLQPPRDVRYVPTPGEVEFALADLACRRSTGFDEAFLAEAARVQAEIMADLEPQLIELNEAVDRLVRAAAESLAD